MKDAAPKAIAVQKAVDAALRSDRGRVLAGLISRLGDFQLAEDALQEAAISALGHWGRTGIPHSPSAWLIRVAHRKAIDRIRKSARETQKAQDYGLVFSKTEEAAEVLDLEDIPDERLRLIFTCCHPALEEKSRVALTLRTVCNLTTREIASVFLDAETTMGQRLSRAKSKIKSKGIRFKVPEAEQWDDRLDTILSTIYLIFTTGYIQEDLSERDLCQEGIYLIRLLNKLRPKDPEIEGALALMLLTESRRHARIDAGGVSVPIGAQDKTLWQEDLLAEGQAVIERAVNRKRPGPFQIKAAITDCHMSKDGPDWAQMSLLYQSLWRFEPTAIVALNWAVVISETGHHDLALGRLDALKTELAQFQPWYAARADILRKLGRYQKAKDAYLMAIEKTQVPSRRAFLEKQLAGLPGG